MATYVVLARYTTEGIKGIKDRVAQPGGSAAAFRRLGESLGVQVQASYSTLGQYDSVAIVEAPNDEALIKTAVAVGMTGVFTTETLRAFPIEDFEKLVAELP